MAKTGAKSASRKPKSTGAGKASGKGSSSGNARSGASGAAGPALLSYLGRAAGKERHIEAALAAHLVMTTRPAYHGRLETHLRDTKVRAEKLEGRMKRLGGSTRSISAPGAAVMGEVKDAAKMVADRAVALAKGSLDAMREDHEAPSLLENARVEYADASEQVATYAVVRALAKASGDKDTAKLAKEFGAEHADLAEFLEKLIPKLSSAVVKTEVRVESKGAASDTSGSSASTSGDANGSSARRTSSGSSRSSSAKRADAGKRASTAKSAGAGKGTGSGTRRSSAKSTSSAKGTGASRSRASGSGSGGSRSRSSGSSSGGSASSGGSSGSRSRASGSGASSGAGRTASGSGS